MRVGSAAFIGAAAVLALMSSTAHAIPHYQGSRGATGDEPFDRNATIVIDRPWPHSSN
ncbi:MAG: hypothetical protein M3280_07945 [Actinomycetota bacterium]|nr:hypothetical protein [Actinomycetota bacterium]